LAPPTAVVGTSAVTVIVPISPTLRVGLVQVMALLAIVQVKSPDSTDCSCSGAGIGSVTVTSRAVLGPRLETVSVYETTVPTCGVGVVVDLSICTSVRTPAGVSTQSTLFDGSAPMTTSARMAETHGGTQPSPRHAGSSAVVTNALFVNVVAA